MKKLIIILSILVYITGMSYSQSIESKIREFAKSEYPNDFDMQNYIYKQQMSAYRYMQTVSDNEVKQIAYREYPPATSRLHRVVNKNRMPYDTIVRQQGQQGEGCLALLQH